MAAGGKAAAGSAASVLSALAAKRADMPDPRPINSAAWKAEAAQKVRSLTRRARRARARRRTRALTPPKRRRPLSPSQVFDLLTATEYPQRVSTKLLLGPTAKDFQAILTHMLRCIDAHYIMVRRQRCVCARAGPRRAEH